MHLKEALTVFAQCLEHQQRAGRKSVWLVPEVREQLKELPNLIRRGAAAAVPAPEAETPPQKERRSTPAPEGRPRAAVREEVPPPQRPERESAAPAPWDEPGSAGLGARKIEPLQTRGETNAEKIASLAEQAEHCAACRGLGTLRDIMVFSVGNPQAELMFVGEAPGFEEEKQREPFVGPAGQKLTQIIQAMGLKREDIYISNIVKFRPKIDGVKFQGPKNRKPTREEMDAAVKYVMAEIDVIRPKVIVALGATAAEGLLDVEGSVGQMRNQFYSLKNIPVMVTYHPSYLLRQQGLRGRRMVWEDMLMVMEELGLPISEKQRGYFSKS